jgi:flagellar biosynthesis/type III secretory pathway chaperone
MNLAASGTRPPAGAGHLDDLVQCLEAEYAALLAEDYERLESVLAQKEILLARLASLSEATAGSAQGTPVRIAAPWKKAFARVRDLNQRNALVLAPRAAGNRARLHFLQSALGRGALYAPDGSVHTALASGTNGRSA